MVDNNYNFYLVDKFGNKTEYHILYTFYSDITNRHYLIYTDGSKDTDGDLELLAGAYNPNNTEIVLESINSDNEWNIIEEYINKLLYEDDIDE